MEFHSVLQSITAVAQAEIVASAASVDAERKFPAESLNRLAEAGAYGLVIPTSEGGAGGSLVALADACTNLGRACASTAMVVLMHSVAAAAITSGGRQKGLLSEMASGRALATLAFSERGTGAHFYSPELRAQRSNGSLRLSGVKSFVTSAGHADIYVLLAQAEQEGAADAYVVDASRPGLSFRGEWDGLGMAGNSSIAMELQDVELSDGDRIGDAGTGLDLVFTVVAPFFLVGLAAVNTGIAAAAAQAAIRHARDRRYPGGGSLAEIQSIQHLMADMDLEARKALLVVQEAARLGEAGDDGALVPIMEAKIAATEAAITVTRRALEVTGGRGYTRGLPIERHLRDAHAGSVMAPTNGVLRNWVGKAVAGLPVP